MNREHGQHGDGHHAHSGSVANGRAAVGHERHAGQSVGMFRDRFWLTLLLAVPTVIWSEMIQPVVLVPAVGAVLMSVSTIVVALNAQLLRRVALRPEQGEPA